MTRLGIGAGHNTMIYLLRHATPERFDGAKRYIGRTDLSLSPAGREQAQRLQQYFSRKPLTGIYCSDLKRSEQTAQVISQGHCLQVSVIPLIREIDMGAWEGLTFDEVRKRDPRGFEQRGQDLANYRPPAGESFQDLQNRVIKAFEQIVQNAEDAIVIMGHAGVNRVLLCHLLQIPLNHLFRIGQDYAAMNVIHKLGAEYRIRALNVSL